MLATDGWLWARWGLLGGLAVAVAVGDVRHRIIPNGLVAGGLVAALAAAAATRSLGTAFLGAAVFGGPLTLLWGVGAVGGGAGLIGAGDAKAALAFGALLGMPGALAGLWWGAVAGGLLALASVGSGLWQARREFWAVLRSRGVSGCLAAMAADPVWTRGIPYGAALAAGSLAAAALLWR